ALGHVRARQSRRAGQGVRQRALAERRVLHGPAVQDRAGGLELAARARGARDDLREGAPDPGEHQLVVVARGTGGARLPLRAAAPLTAASAARLRPESRATVVRGSAASLSSAAAAPGAGTAAPGSSTNGARVPS